MMELVINTFGASLHKRGELFEIRTGDRKAQVSVHKVSSILITTSAHLSTDAIQLAAQHHVDLVFLDRWGEPFGRLWQPTSGAAAAIRRRQLEIAETAEGLEFAVGWIWTKLCNQERFLVELGKRRPKQSETFKKTRRTIRKSRVSLEELQGSPSALRGTIMGLEGSAGRAYFNLLARLMPTQFRFSGRSRHPAQDPFNAALNYAYGVLYSHVERACIVAGLEPFVGVLHCDNYNRPSLVFDLIEPFRIWAERSVVRLFTGRRMKQDYFRPLQLGVALDDPGKPVVVAALNEELERRVLAPGGSAFFHRDTKLSAGATRSGKRKSRRLKQRRLIQREAHALANALLRQVRPFPEIVETEDPAFASRVGAAVAEPRAPSREKGVRDC